MAQISVKAVRYQVDGITFEGHLVYHAGSAPSRGLLMAPNFFGISDAAIAQAKRQVRENSVIFVADPFGVDTRPQTPEEAMAAMGPVRADNAMLRRRMNAALDVLKDEAGKLGVAADNLAAFGFCFGGACVLELARQAAPVKAVASFHGLLQTPDPASTKTPQGAVLVLNGAADPLVPSEAIAGFEQEMNSVKADWQLVNFGGAVHSFTDEGADRPGENQYNAKVSRRAFAMMHDLFDEVLA